MTWTSDSRGESQMRTYERADSVVFLKTKERFGGLSNMAGGFPLCVNGIHLRTSEALYQACRFPHLPEVQRLIIEQRSPMTAKMKTKPHRKDSRSDWDQVRVRIMRWSLRVKLVQNWVKFSQLLLKTGERPIVEQSRRDSFWGAKPSERDTLVGMNVLGRLLMELREEVKAGQQSLLIVEPINVPEFLLYDREIEAVSAQGAGAGTSVRSAGQKQGLLFGGQGADLQRRAGHYQSQPAGYRAFIPQPLPPDPPVRIEGEFQRLLSRADLALGRLDGSIQTLPDPDLFVFMYVRKEAVLSSQIEGIQSSLEDLLAAEAEIFTVDQPRDVYEVVNYVRAMNHGLERLRELPLCIRLIREIHERLMIGSDRLTPGELRRSQNWIGPSGCSLQNATFVPPPPGDLAPALGALEKFLHSPGDLPALVQIGLAHVQFETIHPFLDGNGRIGRLLITLFLCEQEILESPVLYLSHYFKQHRSEYYERLQAVHDKGDWEGWLNFFLEGVLSVSLEATETARRILALREDHRQRITEGFGRAAGNGHRILEHLYERPVFKVAEIERFLGITYAGANSLVARLVRIGLLEEITGQKRHRVFRYAPYLDLFSGTQRPSAP